eukprot:1565532-Rhodomonas_salina.1
MSAIQALATHQLLLFDFSFYNVEFPMDVSILVASKGKPLIHVNCVVKLLPDVQQATHPPLQQQDPQVWELCQTLMGMAKSMICSLAEKHFVSARQVCFEAVLCVSGMRAFILGEGAAEADCKTPALGLSKRMNDGAR